MHLQCSTLVLAALMVLAGCQTGEFAEGPSEDRAPVKSADVVDVPGGSAGLQEAPSEDSIFAESADVVDVPGDFSELQGAGFEKFTSIFGIPVVATQGVSEGTILHVRSVLADYLDNNEDGIADNPRVVFALRESKVVAAVFETFREYEGFDDRNGYRSARPFELITMMQEETDPAYGFDASLEEVLHLVTQLGFSLAYPDELGESGDTGLVRALEEAQDSGDFSYEDWTCDSSCQATEYFYWAITSNMGLQEQRCDEISQEWALCKPELLRERNPAVFELIDSPEFQIPTVSPDGLYEPTTP